MKSANPYRAISLVFIIMVAVGTLLLMLPISRSGFGNAPNLAIAVPQAGPSFFGGAPLSIALFTAVSSSCVTGLILVDTGSYWSTFGQLVVLILIQIGGIGTMTVASYIAVTLRKRLNLKHRIQASTAAYSAYQTDIGSMLRRIMRIAVIIQLSAASILTLRFYFYYNYNLAKALWHGIFHASSAFNNAGFALYADSLESFNSDPIIILVLAACIILGGLGFPVFIEIFRQSSLRKRLGLRFGIRFIRNIKPGKKVTFPKLVRVGKLVYWQKTTQKFSLNVRLVLYSTAVLLASSWIFIATLEWNNPNTLGGMSFFDKLLNSFFSAVSPRTAGFNSIDIGTMRSTTWFGTDFLMYIGAGPASTAGGVKVTTLVVILAITWAQIHGRSEVNLAGYRLSQSVQGQVITLLGLSILLIVFATMIMMAVTPYTLDRCLFEIVSAFGTVGLTTGITPELPVIMQIVICALMVIGRLGPVTLATSLAMHAKPVYYSLPEARPFIG